MSLRFDTFVGWMVLAAALIVSFYAYQALLVVEKPPQELFQVLAQGTRRFGVMENGKCIGTLQTDLKTKPETTIVLNGDLTMSLKGKLMTAKLFVGSYFNVLDQLVACNVSVDLDGSRLAMKLQNPNPIIVQISGSVQDQIFERQFEIPGPILFKSNRDSTYRIDYSAIEKKVQGYRPQHMPPGLLGIKLDVVPIDDHPEICPAERTAENALSLDPLLQQVSGVLNTYRGLLPFPLPGAEP